MGKELEQLKAGRDLMARDNAKLSEQLKGSQEQLTRSVAGLSEQLKANQEQAARDNANAAARADPPAPKIRARLPLTWSFFSSARSTPT